MRNAVRIGALTVFAALGGLFQMGSPASAGPMIYTRALAPSDGGSCDSSLGGYYLPRKNLVATITQADPALPYVLTFGEPEAQADRLWYFCLLYAPSGMSDDEITVVRDTSGLLTSVTSKADNQANAVFEKLLQAALTGATGNPNVSVSRDLFVDKDATKLAELHFDPLDPADLAETNRTLSTYGYCVLVDRYTLDEPRQSRQEYCNEPTSLVAPPPSAAQFVAGQTEPGIIYRQELTYQVSVMHKRDPKGEGPWQLLQTLQIALPNLAPATVVNVDRTVFVQRKTALLFDHGLLSNVDIDKPSEVLAVTEVPLAIADAIVQLPTQILKVRLQSVNNKKELMDINARRIALHRAYLNDKKALEQDPNAQLPATSNGDGLRAANLATPNESFASASQNQCDLITKKNSTENAKCVDHALRRCSIDNLSTCAGQY